MTSKARSTRIIHRLSALVAVSLCACASEPDNRPLPERLGDIKADLTIGSAGDEVAALHEYLTQFGYFPNPELAKHYPRWRPAVSTLPAFDSQFDDQTAAAVRRLQVNNGLEPTGIVDAPTRELLARWRCGVPDNMVPLDPSDKFSTYSVSSNTFVHNFFMDVPFPTNLMNLSAAQFATAMRNAKTTWMQQSSLIMGGAADFGAGTRMSFADIGSVLAGLTDDGGVIPGDCGNGFCRIQFSSTRNWLFTDFESVALHEMGHALGLDHSSFPNTVMAPSTGGRVLAPDDVLAVSTLWDSYWQTPGVAIDIGAGADGSVWALGTDNRPYKWNGAGWDQDRINRTAVRIAVDPAGIPFVVTSSNQIIRRQSNNPFADDWNPPEPGLAIDIGIGRNGDRWIVGTDQRVYKFQGGDWTPVLAFATARRISVSPAGRPWIVTTTGGIQNLSNNDPITGTWQTLPGTGQDIAVGPGGNGPTRGEDGAVFKTDGGNLLVWNEQPALSGPAQSDAPAASGWRIAGYNRQGSGGDANALPLGSNLVAVGQNGRPWVIGTNGAIFTTFR